MKTEKYIDYRTRFRQDPKNKDKSIQYKGSYCTGVGTTKYWATWSGDWTTEELVNYSDNGTGNFGGRIDKYREHLDGTKSGIICVYYD